MQAFHFFSKAYAKIELIFTLQPGITFLAACMVGTAFCSRFDQDQLVD